MKAGKAVRKWAEDDRNVIHDKKMAKIIRQDLKDDNVQKSEHMRKIKTGSRHAPQPAETPEEHHEKLRALQISDILPKPTSDFEGKMEKLHNRVKKRKEAQNPYPQMKQSRDYRKGLTTRPRVKTSDAVIPDTDENGRVHHHGSGGSVRLEAHDQVFHFNVESTDIDIPIVLGGSSESQRSEVLAALKVWHKDKSR